MTVTHTLVRARHEDDKRVWLPRSGVNGADYDGGKYHHQPDYSKYPNLKGIQPFKAMYIGSRTLCNGTAIYEHEDGYHFEFGEKIEAYLLVYHDRNKPVLALPEHCFMVVE